MTGRWQVIVIHPERFTARMTVIFNKATFS